MKVKDWMTRNPLSVKPESLVVDAVRIMAENHIRRLPVVQRGSLVGLVTRRHILEASPSGATSLSRQELNYLWSNLKVGEIMKKNPITLSPEGSVLEAVLLGREKGIGAFPVVDSRGRLVGIASETQIFEAFIQIFGAEEGDVIVEVEDVRLRSRVGVFSRIASLIESLDLPVMGMFSLPQRNKPGSRLYIRVENRKLDQVREILSQHGCRIAY